MREAARIAADEGVIFVLPNAEDRDFVLERLRGLASTDGRSLRIARVVGHLALPSGATLSIRSPKAPAASVLAWLAFCDRSLRSVRWDGVVSAYGAESDVAALTARLFTGELQRALARHGAPRAYVSTRRSGSTVRGRIDFGRLVAAGGDLTRTPCTVWERRPVTKLAELLAAALGRVQRDPLMAAAAGREATTLTEVFQDAIPRVDRPLLEGTVPLGRNELGFEAALELARWILGGCDVSDAGATLGGGFLVNLESLFERTVASALARADLEVQAKRPVRYWRKEGGAGESATMEIDAYCPRLGSGVVVDAKYKAKLSASNIQQVVAYCFATGARTAVLAIPSTAGETATEIRFPDGSGGAPVRIHVVPLQTDGCTVDAWEANARVFSARVRAAVQSPSYVAS